MLLGQVLVEDGIGVQRELNLLQLRSHRLTLRTKFRNLHFRLLERRCLCSQVALGEVVLLFDDGVARHLRVVLVLPVLQLRLYVDQRLLQLEDLSLVFLPVLLVQLLILDRFLLQHSHPVLGCEVRLQALVKLLKAVLLLLALLQHRAELRGQGPQLLHLRQQLLQLRFHRRPLLLLRRQFLLLLDQGHLPGVGVVRRRLQADAELVDLFARGLLQLLEFLNHHQPSLHQLLVFPVRLLDVLCGPPG
mmetsp:Transcript_38230/g.83165  ORF Transcript_38230/g.83165 Transcript_38230/m.83165 type:complete len:247 (-) Transcript_38230:1842-2582(-)